MTPTDILGNIKLYNADCMEVMKTFKDKQFDLAIIDPPYGIGEDGSKNHSRSRIATSKNYKTYSGNDKEPPSADYFKELFRISKNQIVWGANHYMSRLPFDSSCWIVWDKDNGATDFADCELAYTSFNTAVRKFKWRWQGMLQQNMKNKQERIHPNEKPVQLYKWLLQNYAKEGDAIVDTHFGSLSIGIACHDMKFDLTAIELDKDYYEQAKQRLINHQRQLTLF
jgi:site-specific DNA-methyltransferase (adenine-specific)